MMTKIKLTHIEEQMVKAAVLLYDSRNSQVREALVRKGLLATGQNENFIGGYYTFVVIATYECIELAHTIAIDT